MGQAINHIKKYIYTYKAEHVIPTRAKFYLRYTVCKYSLFQGLFVLQNFSDVIPRSGLKVTEHHSETLGRTTWLLLKKETCMNK